MERRKVEKNSRDRLRYEEDNFVRLNVTKKEKVCSVDFLV